MNKYIYTFYCFVISITAAFAQTNDCNHPDYDALVALNNSISGLGWDINDCDVCNWEGVSCNEENRIRLIWNPDNNLSGSLPKEIGDLNGLTMVILRDNQLVGGLPKEIAKLKNLEILSLRNNQLTGSIPKELGNLVNIIQMDFSDNQLTGSIPKELGNLVNIIEMNFSGNQLTGSIPKELSTIGIENISTTVWISFSNNNLSGCYPIELKRFCVLSTLPNTISFSDNPNLPFNGSGGFCSDRGLEDADNDGICNGEDCDDTNPNIPSPEAPCDACDFLQFSSDSNRIIVSRITLQSKVEIIGRNTNWQIIPICDGTCAGKQVIPDLKSGEYTIKVQLIGKDGSYCYREEKVMISGNGNGGGNGNGNTGENANCNNLKFTGEGGQIKIEDLNAAYNKVEIIGRNTDWRIRTICDGNCTDTQLIPNLSAGEYAVKVHQVGADGVYCYREEKVNVTGGGVNGNTSNTANCNNVSFSSTNGQIAVGGLTAVYDKVEIIGRNTNWQVQTICDGNCTDTQIIPNLSNGAYTVKVNQGGNDGSYCYREESINVSTSNTSRTNHKIHLASYQKAQKVALQWTANHLAATKYFLVERSIDGTTFEPLTLIKNIENNTLNWTDEQPQKGKNHYRVRQILDNDQIVYSRVRSETFFLSEKTITLFPNPAKDQLSIHTAFLKGKEGTIQIYNAYGQSVTQQNKVSFETPYQSLDISTLENGIYWLSIQVGTQPMISKRFVVEHWR